MYLHLIYIISNLYLYRSISNLYHIYISTLYHSYVYTSLSELFLYHIYICIRSIPMSNLYHPYINLYAYLCLYLYHICIRSISIDICLTKRHTQGVCGRAVWVTSEWKRPTCPSAVNRTPAPVHSHAQQCDWTLLPSTQMHLPNVRVGQGSEAHKMHIPYPYITFTNRKTHLWLQKLGGRLCWRSGVWRGCQGSAGAQWALCLGLGPAYLGVFTLWKGMKHYAYDFYTYLDGYDTLIKFDFKKMAGLRLGQELGCDLWATRHMRYVGERGKEPAVCWLRALRLGPHKTKLGPLFHGPGLCKQHKEQVRPEI